MMNKFVIKRRIRRMDAAGTVVDPNNPSGMATQGMGAEEVVSTNPVPELSEEELAARGINAPLTAPAISGVTVPSIGLVDTLGNLTGQTHQAYVDDLNRVVEGNMADERDRFRRGYGESDPYDFTTLQLGAEDIGSRFMRMGQAIGRARSDGYSDLPGKAKTANVIGGVASGLSGLLGVARNVMTGVSSAIGDSKNAALAAEREARQRRDSQIQYAKAGGTYLGKGNEFSLGSLNGEYMYPLPKSMEGKANVEVERGEYVTRPGDTPKEALGQTHENGGTPVSLETGTRVISDSLKITPEFAKEIRERYGVRATPKDTYATIMDRYKTKIGLKSAYEDQKKALERLEKNDKIEDDNTRRLNASLLSKAVNEAGERVTELEGRFRDFHDVVYEAQERAKDADIESTYMAKGGEVDRALSEARKKYGFSDEEISEIRARMVAGIKERRQRMETAGPVEELLGRKLTMRTVANPNAQKAYAFQHMNNLGQYGVTNRNWMRDITGIMPLLGSYDDAIKMGETNFARKIENVYTGMNNAWDAMVRNGMLTNPDAMTAYIEENRFLPDKDIDNDDVSSRVRGMEGLLGEWHLSRSNVGFDVVTMDEYNALKDNGMLYYSQLFTEANDAKTKEILGDRYDKLKKLGELEGMQGLDFMLLPYIPDDGSGPLQGKNIAPEVNVDLSPISDKIGNQGTPAATVSGSAPTSGGAPTERPRAGVRPGGRGLYFPEVLRMAPSRVVSEGLERYRAPRVDPVLRSADQYMTEASRAFQAQLDSMEFLPDSQRGALMSNLQAVMGSNIGNYINQVEQANYAARTDARNRNALYWADADAKNIAERLRYQAGYLKGQAINEENWARYYDNVNQENQQKWNAATSMNTLRSIFGDVAYTPDGRIIVSPQGDIVTMPAQRTDIAPEGSETTVSTTVDSKGNTRRTTRTKTKNG